ncbi:MAG: NAD-dependent epimerase/dehydratase family protein, partial [Acidobacteriota bacterium]
MKILVSGASGLIGSALVRRLVDEGNDVARLVRRPPQPGGKEVPWNPETGSLLAADLERMDAVVHLAGENIAAGRWTAVRKQRLRDSRIKATRLLCENLRQLRQPPQVLVCASAIGYYGDRGEDELDEGAAPGEGFLAGLVQEWEGATVPAAESGIRVALARFGVVLSPAGGALAKQLLPFRLG